MRSLYRLGVSALAMAVANEGGPVASEPHYVTQVPDLDPDGKQRLHASGELKGQPVMRDETRDETLRRLRGKYETGAASSDAYVAANSREMLDVLNLIDGQGGSAKLSGKDVDGLLIDRPIIKELTGALDAQSDKLKDLDKSIVGLGKETKSAFDDIAKRVDALEKASAGASNRVDALEKAVSAVASK